MLKKKHIKGLRKKVLKLEYEKKLIFLSKEPSSTTATPNIGTVVKKNPSEQANYRILVLRNAPIDESQLKQSTLMPQLLEISKEGDPQALGKTTRVLSKCVKKNILKKLVNANCKYIYWIAPEAKSLKEQLLQLNMLKVYIRAEPKDSFLGCLLESRFDNTTPFSLDPSKKVDKGLSTYKYYYPSQILSLCDTVDRLGGPTKSTGLEVVGQLLQTIEASINSVSMLLALKKETATKE